MPTTAGKLSNGQGCKQSATVFAGATPAATAWRLIPVTMRPPIRMAAIESVGTVSAEPRPVIPKPRTNDHPNHWRREEDRSRQRARRRRIVVTGRGRAVRLNHFGARIRPDSRSKSECEYRECYHNKFSPHDRISPLLFGRLNRTIIAKLLKIASDLKKFCWLQEHGCS